MRILFIGNSHTYLHRMPYMLAALAAAAKRPLTVEQVCGEGVDLSWHASNTPTVAQIETGGWSHVVLQDRSGGPLEKPQATAEGAHDLHHRIRRAGARTVMFMTWVTLGRPENQQIVAKVYQDIARELGADLAPVGMAWQRCRMLKPELNLHHKDGRHAGKLGAYLTACVFFTLFCGPNTENFPGILHATDRTLTNLSDKDAAFLQKVARETVMK